MSLVAIAMRVLVCNQPGQFDSFIAIHSITNRLTLIKLTFFMDRPSNTSKPLTYVSLFSCAGVGCYGFKMNKFECVATNELIDARLNVQRANHKCRIDSGYISGDITLYSTKSLLFSEIERWRTNYNVSSIDVVIATPPCQGMSTVNYKKTETEQVRNSLVIEAIRIIRDIRPKIFIFENVRAFLKTICTDVDGEDKPILDSISGNLSPEYNIAWRIINFKDYGVPSSRPRTLVIGTLKEFSELSPLLLFPTRCKEITLRNAIGDLCPLGYGEKDKEDPFHFARPYPLEQLNWIKNLSEGQSAFEQDIEHQPGRIDESGNKVINRGAYMGNKYRRLVWDKVCSCIHTRNDVMSSQDTIHPSDNRVLSIRELMRVMTVPDSFRWTPYDSELTPETSNEYLKQHELNIRRCIGEAVPTHIMYDISSKIKRYLRNIDNISDTHASTIFKHLERMTIGNKKNIDILLEGSILCTSLFEQVISMFYDKDRVCIYVPEERSLMSLLKRITLPSNVDIIRGKHIKEPDYIVHDGVLEKYTVNSQLSLFDADSY